MSYLPKVGDVGFYKFKSPFNSLEQQRLECKAIYNFLELQKQRDVLKVAFLNNGLTEADFIYSFSRNDKFALMKSITGIDIYIPVSYFSSYVFTNVFPYSDITLAVKLGLLPDTVPVDHILNEMKLLAQSICGNETEALMITSPADELITESVHQTLEIERTARINSSFNPYKRIQELESQLAEKNSYIEVLETALVEYQP